MYCRNKFKTRSMRIISLPLLAMITMSYFSCAKSNGTSNAQSNNSNGQSNQVGTRCQTNDLYFDIQKTDTSGRPVDPSGIVIDSVTIDSVLVVYRAVADLQSSLSKGSRIDSVIYTGLKSNTFGIGIVGNTSIGKQADFANWETGVYFRPRQFDSATSRRVHVTGIFQLFGSNSIGRIELQVYYIHHGGLHAPDFDSYDDDNCKLR
jgi:hypothetical protein